MSNNEIVVVGIVKDVADTFVLDYQRTLKALSNFNEIFWYIVESDSDDNTLVVLKKISESNSKFNYVSLGTLENQFKSRTEKLAFARNKYLDEINNHPRYKNCKYILVSDFNDLNKKLSVDSVNSCFQVDDWQVCCANQAGPYYDIYALRHHLWSPNDCWSQHSFYRQYHRFPEKSLLASVKIRMIKIPYESEWIKVDSAFGGLAIYEKDTFKLGRYEGKDTEGNLICEHVSLNLAISKSGKKIFINPKFINFVKTDHSSIISLKSVVKRFMKYPTKFLKKISLD
jgi:hypothetical protein